MDYSKVPLLLREIKKVLRTKGIKFQHIHTSCIVTRTFTKELHPVIFSIDTDFPNRVTISTVPLSNWSFTCEATTIEEIISKAHKFSQTIKCHLYIPRTYIKKIK